MPSGVTKGGAKKKEKTKGKETEKEEIWKKKEEKKGKREKKKEWARKKKIKENQHDERGAMQFQAQAGAQGKKTSGAPNWRRKEIKTTNIFKLTSFLVSKKGMSCSFIP